MGQHTCESSLKSHDNNGEQLKILRCNKELHAEIVP
jgi:hypothetical protein